MYLLKLSKLSSGAHMYEATQAEVITLVNSILDFASIILPYNINHVTCYGVGVALLGMYGIHNRTRNRIYRVVSEAFL